MLLISIWFVEHVWSAIPRVCHGRSDASFPIAKMTIIISGRAKCNWSVLHSPHPHWRFDGRFVLVEDTGCRLRWVPFADEMFRSLMVAFWSFVLAGRWCLSIDYSSGAFVFMGLNSVCVFLYLNGGIFWWLCSYCYRKKIKCGSRKIVY